MNSQKQPPATTHEQPDIVIYKANSMTWYVTNTINYASPNSDKEYKNHNATHHEELIKALNNLVERTEDMAQAEGWPEHWPEWEAANELLRKLNETEMD